MQYLVNPRRPSKVAHIWNEKNQDTYCTQWTTNGLNTEPNYIVTDDCQGKRVCFMCRHNLKKAEKAE